MNNKLHFSLREKECDNDIPTYDELVKQVDMMELSSDANIDDRKFIETPNTLSQTSYSLPSIFSLKFQSYSK